LIKLGTAKVEKPAVETKKVAKSLGNVEISSDDCLINDEGGPDGEFKALPKKRLSEAKDAEEETEAKR